MGKLDASLYCTIGDLKGDDERDTVLLKRMAAEAEVYIARFSWSQAVSEIRFGCGIGGIVAVFLFEFKAPIKGFDDQLWVVTGDLPSAYLVTDAADNPKQALSGYCELMLDWCVDILEGHLGGETFPVDAAPTEANAKALRRRIDFIKREILIN